MHLPLHNSSFLSPLPPSLRPSAGTHTDPSLVGEGKGGEGGEGEGGAAIPVLYRHTRRQTKQRNTLRQEEISVVPLREPRG